MTDRFVDTHTFDGFEPDPNENLWAVLSLEVRNAAICATGIVFDYSTSEPAPGTRAAELKDLDHQYTTQDLGNIHASQALRNMSLIIMSGNEHMEALGHILDPQPIFGPSVSTLTRGAVEAFAKARYLMDTDSDREFIRKYLASRRSSLKRQARTKRDENQKPIETKRSQAASREIDQVNAAATAWGFDVSDISPQSFTATVEQLLEQFLDEGAPTSLSSLYADLSATAHAELSGLAFFLTKPSSYNASGVGAAHIGPNLQFVNFMIQTVLRAQMDIMFDFIDLYGVSDKDQEDWRDALRKVIFWAAHIDNKASKGATS
jgi:hypothetical protein